MKLERLIPLYGNLKKYEASNWRQDILAGIIVSIIIIPQGMAYALLAGMPPIYGLYGGLIPLIVYGIFGTSGQLAIGPVAISSILLFAGVSHLADPFSASYIELIILTGFLAGVLQLLLGIFRLGFLVNFISQPVITGFTAAAAVIIFVSQLKTVLGILVPRSDNLIDTVTYLVHHISELNWLAVAFCVVSLIILIVLKKISKAIPGALIVVVSGILAAYGLAQYGLSGELQIVGEIPTGLPVFQVPDFSIDNILLLLPTVLTVGIMGVVECIGIAKGIQRDDQTSKVRPNMELSALGLSKMAGSFFQALPSSGSFSRSAINDEAGSKSGLSSITTALMVGLTLIFFTKLFYYLPSTVLAAIIIYAIRNLFDVKEMRSLWKSHKIDFSMMAVTFFITVFFGIEKGVITGVLLSLAIFIYRSSRPHMVRLGRLPDSEVYRNLDRFEEAKCPEDVLIVRIDNQLFYANVLFFEETIQHYSRTRPELRLVILDASGMHNIDSTGIRVLTQLYSYYKKRNTAFVISGAIGPVRDIISSSALLTLMGQKSFFLEIHDAMQFHGAIEKDKDDTGWSEDAVQSNF